MQLVDPPLASAEADGNRPICLPVLGLVQSKCEYKLCCCMRIMIWGELIPLDMLCPQMFVPVPKVFMQDNCKLLLSSLLILFLWNGRGLTVIWILLSEMLSAGL